MRVTKEWFQLRRDLFSWYYNGLPATVLERLSKSDHPDAPFLLSLVHVGMNQYQMARALDRQHPVGLLYFLWNFWHARRTFDGQVPVLDHPLSHALRADTPDAMLAVYETYGEADLERLPFCYATAKMYVELARMGDARACNTLLWQSKTRDVFGPESPALLVTMLGHSNDIARIKRAIDWLTSACPTTPTNRFYVGKCMHLLGDGYKTPDNGIFTAQIELLRCYKREYRTRIAQVRAAVHTSCICLRRMSVSKDVMRIIARCALRLEAEWHDEE